jgi:hypothetical protein
MKLHEFLTGILMFAIILGIVTLSQPAQAGGNHHPCHQACGDTKPDPAPVVNVIVADDDESSLKRFWAKYRKPVTWISAIGLGISYTPKFRNDVATGREGLTVTVNPRPIGDP